MEIGSIQENDSSGKSKDHPKCVEPRLTEVGMFSEVVNCQIRT
jgi:hypothetical protein